MQFEFASMSVYSLDLHIEARLAVAISQVAKTPFASLHPLRVKVDGLEVVFLYVFVFRIVIGGGGFD